MADTADPSHAAPGQDDYVRQESEAARLDRNYYELLQELRVAQTGVQILFAFLLSIAFQQRFDSITSAERVVYVVTLMLTAAATMQLIAPVAVHRLVFRLHRKDALVRVTNRLAISGLSTLFFAVLGAVLLILMYVTSTVLAILVVVVFGVVFGWLWAFVPLSERRRRADIERPA
ncbi:MAG: DUF6328 family protein [Jatrophihabitans sp.]